MTIKPLNALGMTPEVVFNRILQDKPTDVMVVALTEKGPLIMWSCMSVERQACLAQMGNAGVQAQFGMVRDVW